MTNLKINRAQQKAGIAGMSATSSAVMAALATEANELQNCTSKQLAAVMRLIQSQYHAGRKSCAAEIIDGDALWVGAGIDKLLPLAAIRAINIDESIELIPASHHSGRDWPTGQWSIKKYSLDYQERI